MRERFNPLGPTENMAIEYKPGDKVPHSYTKQFTSNRIHSLKGKYHRPAFDTIKRLQTLTSLKYKRQYGNKTPSNVYQ